MIVALYWTQWLLFIMMNLSYIYLVWDELFRLTDDVDVTSSQTNLFKLVEIVFQHDIKPFAPMIKNWFKNELKKEFRKKRHIEKTLS